jgi:hypothetical protein
VTARMKSEPGPPMTLGAAAAAGVRLIVWCKECRYQVEPDPAEQAGDTARRCPSSNGASGLCARSVAVMRSIWW